MAQIAAVTTMKVADAAAAVQANPARAVKILKLTHWTA
jgi:hypothetical protein